MKSRVFTHTNKHILQEMSKHKPYSYSHALQLRRGHNQGYRIGSVVANKSLQCGHKGNVNANISSQSTTDVQRRESTNIVFRSVNHCLKAVVPRAHMDKAAPTSKMCSGVFITRMLPRCTSSQLTSHIQDTGGVHTKLAKAANEIWLLQFILCQMCTQSEKHFNLVIILTHWYYGQVVS